MTAKTVVARCELMTVVDGLKLVEESGFRRPKELLDVQAMAEAYYKQLKDLPATAVTEGFNRFIRAKESEHWPPPGKLRGHALEVMRENPMEQQSTLGSRYVEWEKRGWRDELGTLSPCPVCNVMPTEVEVTPSRSPLALKQPAGAAPAKRLAVQHDRHRHREDGVRFLTW